MAERLLACLLSAWLLASLARAGTLRTDGLALELDDAGEVASLLLADRPARLTAAGGVEVWDAASDTEATTDHLGVEDTWVDDNEWGFSGPLWRRGPTWTTVPDAWEGHAALRTTVPASGYSEPLRLIFPVAAEAVYVLRVPLRPSGFQGRLRIGAVPVNAAGAATGRFTPLAAPAPWGPDGSWQFATGVVAPPPMTALLQLWVACEAAAGSLEVGGAEVTVRTGGRRLDLAGRLVTQGKALQYRGEAEGLSVTADYRVADEAIRVRLGVTAPPGPDRALRLRLRLPIDGTGWTWWQDVDTGVTVTDVGYHSFANWVQVGDGHLTSPYPLACVTRPAPAQGVALAVPLSQPAITRLAFRPGEGLSATFDLGLAPRERSASRTVELVIYPADATWGLRSALSQYYALYPSDTAGQEAPAGAWFTALNPDAVPDPQTYGLVYDEQADSHLSWARQAKVKTLRRVLGAATAEPAAKLAATDGGQLDGLLFSGLGGSAANWLSDRPVTPASANAEALTFSPSTRDVVEFAGFTALAALRREAQQVRDAGALVVGALDDAWQTPWALASLDVVAAGETRPAEVELKWLRALARHKPLTWLDPDLLDPSAMLDEQRDRWQQALVWAACPGSAGWLSRRTIDLQAIFFDVYLPVLRDLAAAGWEPVPYAFVSDAAVTIERYGRRDDLYLVLSNPTDQQRLVTVTLEPLALGLVTTGADGTVERRLLFVNRLSRSQKLIEFRVALDRWQANFNVPPRSIQVLTPQIASGLGLLTDFDALKLP